MTDFQKQINYWKKSGEKNWKVAQSLFNLGHCDACLFFCHLSLEKLLKGLVVEQSKKAAPYIHDLTELTEIARLKLSDEQIQNLRLITGFNIASRYDDIKFAFYRQCTKSYAEKYFKISQELYLWFKKQYPKK